MMWIGKRKEHQVRRKFPIVEIGIIVAAAALIYVLERPRYQTNRAKLRQSDAVYNLYVYKVAIEEYAAYNNGVFPASPDKIEPYLEGGNRESQTPGLYPQNPYTGQALTKKNIRWVTYDNITDSRDDHPKGANGRQIAPPGWISVGWFIPPGESLATDYGLITFGIEGKPIHKKDPSGQEHVIVIHN